MMLTISENIQTNKSKVKQKYFREEKKHTEKETSSILEIEKSNATGFDENTNQYGILCEKITVFISNELESIHKW